MDGETSSEMTIVVRAQDAASSVLRTIGRSIGRILLTPLRVVGKAVGDITKQFFGLKGLLLGGGFIAAMRGLSLGLAKNAKEFQAVFSDDVQRRIDATATAFNKLGASLKATFGNIIAEFKIDEALNGLSDWLQNNQATVVQKIRDIAEGFGTAADKVAGFFTAIESGWNKTKSFFEDAALKYYFGGRSGTTRAPAIDPRDENLARSIVGLPSESFGPPMPPEEAAADWSQFSANVFAAHDAVRALKAESRPAREAVAALTKAEAEAAPIVAEVTKAVEEQTVAVAEASKEIVKAQEIIDGYLSVAEFADIAASNITDGFESIVRGTESVGRAFAGMVSTIIGELGRLLLYRSLLNLITSAFSLGNAASASGGGAFTSESGYGGLTSTAYAAGGKVRRTGVARVGENGPEQVVLPRGAQVVPAQRSRGSDGGGMNVTVYGARDARATAREVVAEIRRDASLRRALLA